MRQEIDQSDIKQMNNLIFKKINILENEDDDSDN